MYYIELGKPGEFTCKQLSLTNFIAVNRKIGKHSPQLTTLIYKGAYEALQDCFMLAYNTSVGHIYEWLGVDDMKDVQTEVRVEIQKLTQVAKMDRMCFFHSIEYAAYKDSVCSSYISMNKKHFSSILRPIKIEKLGI